MTSNQDSSDRYDTIEDYMLMNAPRRAKEKPICQTLCSVFVIAFAVAAMATDELSDGDIDVEFTTEDEDIDFDCGWRHVLFTFTEIDPDDMPNNNNNIEAYDDTISDDLELSSSIQGLSKFISKYSINTNQYNNNNYNNNLERRLLQRGNGNGGPPDDAPIQPTDDSQETLTYSSNKLCEAFDEFDNDWCHEMEAAGIIWLVCGILSILSSVIAIISIWKVKNKASKLYFGFMTLSGILILFSTLYWLSESRCDEFEDIEGDEAHSVTMEVDVGASISLMYVALGFNVLGCLISGFYVFCKKNKDELSFDYNFQLRQQAGLVEDATQLATVNDNDNDNNAGNNESPVVNGDNNNEIDGNNVNVLAPKAVKPKKGYEQVNDEENDQE